MAQSNFGQAIAQHVASAADRAQKAQTRALQVQQQIEDRELEREIQRAQQAFRQKQLNLQAEQFNADTAFNLAQLRQERSQFEEQMAAEQERIGIAQQRADTEAARLQRQKDGEDKLTPNQQAQMLLRNLQSLNLSKQQKERTAEETEQGALQAGSEFVESQVPLGAAGPVQTPFQFFQRLLGNEEQALEDFETGTAEAEQTRSEIDAQDEAIMQTLKELSDITGSSVEALKQSSQAATDFNEMF